MSKLIDDIRALATVPDEADAYRAWLRQDDALAFLCDNAGDGQIVIYAGVPYVFIHAVLVPNDVLVNPDIPDLLGWNHNPYSSWSVVASANGAWIEPPLADCDSKSLAKGEQIVFARSFDEIPDRGHYVEILQALTHTAGLHFMPERNAWCRLDRHGDLEDVIHVVDMQPPGNETWGGTIVLVSRDVLETYATLTDSSLVRMFDFTRFRISSFSGWGSHQVEQRSDGDVHYRIGVIDGHASYTRGVQIVPFAKTKKEVAASIWSGTSGTEKKQYATYIAHDWKNNRIAELSCAPDHLANYFIESNLPFEITPAFFRPEVLLKYKADRDKYTLQERSVSCRGAWHIQTFDVNDAGQVHTYLVYLGRLPYEEQLHWKQYNEPPKAPISRCALATDMEGRFHNEYNPLQSLKHKLSELHQRRVPWWKLRSPELRERSNYPVTTSADEWGEEILNLDQLVVEGFEEKWLRGKAVGLGRAPAVQMRALKLVEGCLVGLGFEEDHARRVVGPLHEIHNLRNKLKGHASGDTARSIRSSVLTAHKTYRNHFKHLAGQCDEAIGTIMQAFEDDRMKEIAQRSRSAKA
ncbi:MAG: hypothetical protein AB7P52_06250 [Alphaproteobacteria bacterium]